MNYLVLAVVFHFLFRFFFCLQLLEATIATMKLIRRAHSLAGKPAAHINMYIFSFHSFSWQEVRANGSKANDTKHEHEIRKKSAMRELTSILINTYKYFCV